MRTNTQLAAMSCLLLTPTGACAPVGGGTNESSSHPVAGSLSVALTIEGHTVERVELSLASEDLEPVVTRTRAIDVSDPNATVSAIEGRLPPAHYTLGLTAHITDDPQTPEDEGEIGCEGSASGIAVAAGEIARVDDLVLLCTRDGGQLQTAGGLQLDARLEYEEENTCGDLAREIGVAPLATSVGAEIDLWVDAKPGVNVVWQAAHGVVSADGSTYTCPTVAGRFAIEATLTAPDGCSETFSQTVDCHSAYTGSCGTLPTAFGFEGSCGLRTPCTLSQDGCRWEANCRGRTFGGEAAGANSFPFVESGGERCSATLVDGELVGSCVDDEGDSCDFTTNSTPDPVPACARLSDTLAEMTACGHTYASCAVIQQGCRYQANCDGTVVGGEVNGEQLQWDVTVDGSSFRCEGPLADGAVSGTCTQRGRGIEDPITCSDFTGNVPLVNLGDCEPNLDTDGFVLDGCGLDGIYFGAERGCVWSLTGPVTAGGIAAASNSYAFELPDGRSCSASVVDDALQGSCTGAGESCAFQTVEAIVNDSCYQIPPEISSSGCGGSQNCTVFQDGCGFAASCNGGGNFLAGEATETGIAFPGINPDWTCQADLNADGTALLGNCTRPNADGSVSNCRDLTAQQGARLLLTWPTP